LFPPSFSGRANRGLLVEAPATEEAGASLATGTSEEECAALAPMSRRTVLHGRKKDGFGAVEMEDVVGDGYDDASLIAI